MGSAPEEHSTKGPEGGRDSNEGAAVKGRFIVLEGIDGTGKSTLARRLKAALEARGRKVLLTEEPTGRPSGQLIRERLVDKSGPRPNAWEWLGMFVADRRINMDEIVKPALAAGIDVVQDRSMYSTVVYQGEMGIPEEEILRRHTGWHPTPDLVAILDIAPRFGLARTKRRLRGHAARRYPDAEQKYLFADGDAPQSTEKLHFLQRLRRRYRNLKGDFIFRLPVRESTPGGGRDRTTGELCEAILQRLDKLSKQAPPN